MKRILSIALLSIFTFSTVGVIASSYSCNMMKMKLNKCCGMSCCKHEVKLLRVKDEFVSSIAQDVPKTFISSFITVAPAVSGNYFPFYNILFSEDNHSPPGKIIDRLSFIQSFLI